MEKMMQRLTMDKARQYTCKAVNNVRRRIGELVCEWDYKPWLLNCHAVI